MRFFLIKSTQNLTQLPFAPNKTAVIRPALFRKINSMVTLITSLTIFRKRNLSTQYMPSCLSLKTPPNKIHYKKSLKLKGTSIRSLRPKIKIKKLLLGRMNLMGNRELMSHKIVTIRQKISPRTTSKLFSLLSLRIKIM